MSALPDGQRPALEDVIARAKEHGDPQARGHIPRPVPPDVHDRDEHHH